MLLFFFSGYVCVNCEGNDLLSFLPLLFRVVQNPVLFFVSCLCPCSVFVGSAAVLGDYQVHDFLLLVFASSVQFHIPGVVLYSLHLVLPSVHCNMIEASSSLSHEATPLLAVTGVTPSHFPLCTLTVWDSF